MKKLGIRGWGLGFSLIMLTLLFLYPIPYTLYPAHAQVDIGETFAFGWIKTLGQGVNILVIPTFSIAAVVVVIYFLIGAFKFLTSGGDKEAVASARDMITHAILGFIILMFTFLILQFLLSSLFGIKGLDFIGKEGV